MDLHSIPIGLFYSTEAFRPSLRTQLLAAGLVVFRALHDHSCSRTRSDLHAQKECLQRLAGVLGRWCWGYQRAAVTIPDPPAQLFMAPSPTDLWNMFSALKQLTSDVLPSLPDWNETSRYLKDMVLHACLLQVKFEVVASRHAWHPLYLMHAVLVWSMNSSAACEGVGSTVRFIERKHKVGRPLSTGHLVRAAQLRHHGVRGGVADIGFCFNVWHVYKSEHKKVRFFIGDLSTCCSSRVTYCWCCCAVLLRLYFLGFGFEFRV